MSHVTVTHAERVTWIRFERPAKKNALTLAMYSQVTAALQRARTDRDRVVVLAGLPGMFTAGNDLADFMSRQSELHIVLDFLAEIASFPKPLLAAVDGVAIGIGTTLLLHCDAVWCTARSTFRTPFVDLGLVPEAASSLLLPQLVGHRVATQMLLAGRALSGDEAGRYGLVNQVVQPDALDDHVQEHARQLAAKAPAALRQSKALIRDVQRERVQAIMSAEADVFRQRLASPEFHEAATAFAQKRAPDFSAFD